MKWKDDDGYRDAKRNPINDQIEFNRVLLKIDEIKLPQTKCH
jgi:hypothetical protein